MRGQTIPHKALGAVGAFALYLLTLTAAGCPPIVLPESKDGAVADAAADAVADAQAEASPETVAETATEIDSSDGCKAYCVGQQAYACNADNVIVAAQVCSSDTLCTNGACVPVDKDTLPEVSPEVSDGGDDGAETSDTDAGDEGPDDGGCVPACDGLECGDDGCGGNCGDCAGGAVCNAGGQCECTPDSQNICDGGDSYLADSCGNLGALATGCGGNGCTDGFCDNCIPQCAGLNCGSDGCGGTCGTCTGGEVCAAGLCGCEAEAEQKCVGDALHWHDSCGNQQAFIENCPYGCSAGACSACVPACGQAECGNDGCGGSCGICDTGESCVSGACTCTAEATSMCLGGNVYWYDSCGVPGEVKTTCPGFGCTNGSCDGCTPDCTGKQCGDDGCGGECGPCTGNGEVCQANQCNCLNQVYTSCNNGDLWHYDSCNNPESVASTCQYGCTGNSCDACQPQCTGKNCGPDGCGGTCGTCTGADTCSGTGQCVCQPQCSGVECGNDGCGGTCGACTGQDTCNTAGECVCQPNCAGKDCGADGCGGTCGACTGQDTCSSNGQCVCQPACAGKECGSNGCGGICGVCSGGASCTSGGQCESPDLGHLIFTTKGAWAPGSFGGGLALQDYRCQQSASKSNVAGALPRTWIALMSDSILKVDAKDRPMWSGALGNTQGELITNSPESWPIDGNNPPQFDADGNPTAISAVATGTKTSGIATALECASLGRAWNTMDGEVSLGDNQSAGDKFIENGGTAGCNEALPIYCVNVSDTPDHIIFATSWTGDAKGLGGLSQADVICQEHGNQYDSKRSWVALMSDSVRGIEARNRVGWHGPVYNTTGKLVKADPENWPWTPLVNPVRFDESGKDLGENAKAFTGSKNDGTPSGGDCANSSGTYAWVNNSPMASVGRVHSTSGSNGWFNAGGIDSCGGEYHLYCVSR